LGNPITDKASLPESLTGSARGLRNRCIYDEQAHMRINLNTATFSLMIPQTISLTSFTKQRILSVLSTIRIMNTKK